MLVFIDTPEIFDNFHYIDEVIFFRLYDITCKHFLVKLQLHHLITIQASINREKSFVSGVIRSHQHISAHHVITPLPLLLNKGKLIFK